MIRKNNILIYAMLPIGIAITILILALPSSCKKEVWLPVVETTGVSQVGDTSASCSGKVTSEGTAALTDRGVCWSTGNLPTVAGNKTSDGLGTGAFTAQIRGLAPNTFYHVRAFATNQGGTAYGSTLSFHTYLGSVTDIDGNVYHTTAIGNQIWMAENLRTKRTSDGAPIQLVTEPTAWANYIDPLYCFYRNNEDSVKIPYGALYNWYAVGTGKLCPTGWHVPANDEWQELIVTLGDSLVAGAKMKESGTLNWEGSNSESTNESGFTALPGGILLPVSQYGGCGGTEEPGFHGLGAYGYWWSSTQTDQFNAMERMLLSGTEVYKSPSDKRFGISVRCVKD